ncbi:MAG TPA: hypothetical protein VE570_03930 [Thermoleophilaceae bacterium]|nr:hypothetical protein [Thermoleophilaceae bacterium]
MTILGAAANPAGGAATQDIVLATGGAMILTTFVVVTGVLYRSGRVRWLHKLADFSERQWGVPAWVALPGEIASVSLIVALLGMYWDISLHLDQGRDPGPLANPAHYLILFGLFGVFVAGFFAIVMGDHRGGSSMIERAPRWKVPVGGVMLFACASFSLLGFPLDDGWHRIFGQDVTLWGPTHLMLFGGAGMTLIGRASLLVEGQRAARRQREQVKNGNGAAGPPSAEAMGIPGSRLMNFQKAGLIGGFLIGMSTFQGEFDFGVPQFQLVFHPILIAWAAGIALVTARVWGGRWAALVAVAFFLVVRGIVSIFVGPIMGEVTPHFPIYIVEALLVEAIAFLMSTRKPVRFGAACGLAIGTIGFASEWLWSHIWMPIPWPSSLMPEALIWAIVAGVSGGLLGALIGSALASDRKPFPRRGVKPALALASVAIFAMVGYGLHVNNDAKGATAHFQLRDVDGGPGRYVQARITLDPRTAAGDSKWVSVTAWQGGGLVVNRLKKLSEGVYETTKPIPVNGDWKALLRVHKGNAILGAPVYLPGDPAIPAKEVPAKADVTRPLVADHKILQRESKSASGILPLFAYLGVLAIALGLCALMTWGLARLARDGDAGVSHPQPRATLAPQVRSKRQWGYASSSS